MAQHHVIPFKTYVNVAIALFVLTVLTVLFHQMDLGVLKGPVAFLIASVKASLVLLYFMHLKYDSMMNRVIFGSAFFFLLLLIAFSALDIWTRLQAIPTL